MAFIEFKVDLTRVADALERIAQSAERMCPVRAEPKDPKAVRFFNVSPEAIAEAEEEEERRKVAGTEEA